MTNALQDILRTADQVSRYAKSSYRSNAKTASRKYDDASEYAGEIAADALESAAQIARSLQKNAAVAQSSVARIVHDRPVGAILLAVAVGVMIGFAARR